MIAVDTNILIYAHREDSIDHSAALRCVRSLAEGGRPWAIPWPCIHEFLGIVTRQRIFSPPTPLSAALAQVDDWLRSPELLLLSETHGHWPALKQIALEARISGPRIHDARIAALCREHAVSEIWSADRDFSRFPGVRVINPLVG